MFEVDQCTHINFVHALGMYRTVTDLGSNSNLLGFCIALLSVLSSTMQQIFCRTMQHRNGLGFLEFLSHTAMAQVFFLPY
jgi:hypothetical protein